VSLLISIASSGLLVSLARHLSASARSSVFLCIRRRWTCVFLIGEFTTVWGFCFECRCAALDFRTPAGMLHGFYSITP
jgi:hypothetical protein